MYKRVTKIIEYKKITPNGMARLLNMNQPTLARYLSGERTMPSDVIIKILTAFPEISAEWLMRGEGDMIKDRATNSEEIEKLKLELARKDGMVDILLTQLKDNKPSGGAGEPLV